MIDTDGVSSSLSVVSTPAAVLAVEDLWRLGFQNAIGQAERHGCRRQYT